MRHRHSQLIDCLGHCWTIEDRATFTTSGGTRAPGTIIDIDPDSRMLLLQFDDPTLKPMWTTPARVEPLCNPLLPPRAPLSPRR
jgi:hypothetical protein